jgi:hypothetical protein
VDVWAAVDTLHKCGFIDVPDIPARAFQVSPGVVNMVGLMHHHLSVCVCVSVCECVRVSVCV